MSRGPAPELGRGAAISQESNNKVVNILIGSIVTAAIVGAGVVVWKMIGSDPTPPVQTNLSTEVDEIPEEKIHYRPVGSPIETGLSGPKGLAVGTDGRIHVGGGADKLVRVFDSHGNKAADIKTGGATRALAVAENGAIYVALRDRVEVYNASGARQAAWAGAGDDAVFTSIAVSKADVFVANVVQRRGRVLRYRRSDGKLLQTLDGRADGDEKDTGFVVPSPYFDLAIGAEGWLWVVNPGRLRVEAYQLDCGPVLDADGKRLRWGRPGKELDRFCGCCNPAHIAILPGGGFVTAEKGLTRIKTYDKALAFLGVVGGPKQFATHDEAVRGRGAGGADIHGLEVAVDKSGRVYVLDSATGQVRIFVRKGPASSAPSGGGS